LRPGFVVEGGERERYALKRVYTSFWDLHHNPSPKRRSWIGPHFNLRFGFVVEGRRDGTSFGIKEMK
jgi:hypothetical protein